MSSIPKYTKRGSSEPVRILSLVAILVCVQLRQAFYSSDLLAEFETFLGSGLLEGLILEEVAPSEAAVNQEDRIVPPTGLTGGKTTTSCEISVMIETNRGTAYIEELVAYYLSHGATRVILFDHSDHNTSEVNQQLLDPFIRRNQVEYTHDSLPFSRPRQQTNLTHRVHDFIKNRVLFAKDNNGTPPRPHWLLSIDDDEYIFPTFEALTSRGVSTEGMDNRSLSHFLCSPRVLKYPLVRFRWRNVGSLIAGNWTQEEMRKKMDIELFTHMAKTSNAIGKSAYQISHQNMTVDKWLAQDLPWKDSNIARPGGAFFLHGHNFRFFDHEFDPNYRAHPKHPMCLEAGYTYHFTRSMSSFSERNALWADLGRKRVVNKRDVSDMPLYLLSEWGQKMRDDGWYGA